MPQTEALLSSIQDSIRTIAFKLKGRLRDKRGENYDELLVKL